MVTVGHEFLQETFGLQVNYGWQIDMFSGFER